MRAVAAGGAVGVGDGEVEAALKEAPGDARGVEQVADVLAGHLDRWRRCRGADVAGRIGIADEGEAALAVGDDVAAGVGLDRSTPLVWPEMRLMAPGVEGPKVVPKELSFMA